MLKTTQAVENFSLSIAKDAEVGSIDDDYEEKPFERLSLTSKNLNKAIDYLIPKARLAFTQLRKAFTKTLIF